MLLKVKTMRILYISQFRKHTLDKILQNESQMSSEIIIAFFIDE